MNVQVNPAAERLNQAQATIEEQIRLLRSQVETLISDRAAPYAADLAAQAEDAARRGYQVARENVDLVSERVKQRPLTSVLVAGIAGFVVARLFR